MSLTRSWRISSCLISPLVLPVPTRLGAIKLVRWLWKGLTAIIEPSPSSFGRVVWWSRIPAMRRGQAWPCDCEREVTVLPLGFPAITGSSSIGGRSCPMRRVSMGGGAGTIYWWVPKPESAASRGMLNMGKKKKHMVRMGV